MEGAAHTRNLIKPYTLLASVWAAAKAGRRRRRARRAGNDFIASDTFLHNWEVSDVLRRFIPACQTSLAESLMTESGCWLLVASMRIFLKVGVSWCWWKIVVRSASSAWFLCHRVLYIILKCSQMDRYTLVYVDSCSTPKINISLKYFLMNLK